MTKKIFIICFLMLLVKSGDNLYAQMGMGPPNPPCDNDPSTNFPPCPQSVPIDGGIFLLVGAGLTLGARKLLKKKESDSL